MAVSLKNIDYTSGCATFFYDDWATDGDKLPRIGIAGKDNLNTVKGCSQGSFAIGTDGASGLGYLISLNGNTFIWHKNIPYVTKLRYIAVK